MLNVKESENVKTLISFDGFFENFPFSFKIEFPYAGLKPIELREAVQDFVYSIKGELFDQISTDKWGFTTDYFKRNFILQISDVQSILITVEKKSHSDEYIYMTVTLPKSLSQKDNHFELAKRAIEFFLKMLP
ncbi:MAG: hypothetical protein QXI09_03570 [Candidatus Aenigmatarchaeota archaeon]